MMTIELRHLELSVFVLVQVYQQTCYTCVLFGIVPHV